MRTFSLKALARKVLDKSQTGKKPETIYKNVGNFYSKNKAKNFQCILNPNEKDLNSKIKYYLFNGIKMKIKMDLHNGLTEYMSGVDWLALEILEKYNTIEPEFNKNCMVELNELRDKIIDPDEKIEVEKFMSSEKYTKYLVRYLEEYF